MEPLLGRRPQRSARRPVTQHRSGAAGHDRREIRARFRERGQPDGIDAPAVQRMKQRRPDTPRESPNRSEPERPPAAY